MINIKLPNDQRTLEYLVERIRILEKENEHMRNAMNRIETNSIVNSPNVIDMPHLTEHLTLATYASAVENNSGYHIIVKVCNDNEKQFGYYISKNYDSQNSFTDYMAIDMHERLIDEVIKWWLK